MQTVQREVFVAEDGKEFMDIEKCSEHETLLRNQVELDEFLASLDETVTERAKSRMQNDILKFLAWRERQTAEADTKSKKAA